MDQKQKWTPRLAQKKGIKRGLKGNCAMFLQPGVGKTSLGLELFRRLKRRRQAKRLLVIAPLNPCYLVWPLEIKKWANFNHFKWTILHGFGKERRLHTKNADISIINPEGLAWLENELGGCWHSKFDMLIVDESTKFKSTTSNVFKLLKRHLDDFRYIYPLTGTPCPEGVQDFYAQIYLVDQGTRLGATMADFRRKYFHTNMMGVVVKGRKRYFPTYEARADARDLILEKIKDISVTMLSSDYADLPAVTDKLVLFDLPPRMQRHYKTMAKSMAMEWGGVDLVADSASEKYSKLKQMASGFIYDTDELTGLRTTTQLHRERTKALIDLIDEIGEPCILAYTFKEDLTRIKKALGKRAVVLNESRKEVAEADWNAGKIPVLVLHPQSGAHGLNLQYGGCNLIWYNLPTSGETFEQMIYRLRRPGSKARHIFQHFLIARETIDEECYRVMTSKVDTQEMAMVILKKHFESMG